MEQCAARDEKDAILQRDKRVFFVLDLCAGVY